MRLGHREWKALFEALAELYSDSTPETLGARSVAAAKRIISSEITAFDFFNADGTHAGTHWHDPPDSITKAEYEIFARLAHDHPLVPPVFGSGVRAPMTISDVLTQSQFRDTEIYNEYYRLLSINHQLVIPFQLSADSLVTCAFNRIGKDFTQEERQMIELIGPHLKNAISNGRKMERLLAAEAGLNVLAGKSAGIIAVDDAGRVIFSSFAARELLRGFYDSDKDDEVIPASLKTWADDCVKVHAADPLVSEFKLKRSGETSTLQITLALNSQKRERTFILESTRTPSPHDLRPLGLTKRQSEILFWISKGKTR